MTTTPVEPATTPLEHLIKERDRVAGQLILFHQKEVTMMRELTIYRQNKKRGLAEIDLLDNAIRQLSST